MTAALEQWDQSHAAAHRAGRLVACLVMLLAFLGCLLASACTVGPIATVKGVSMGGSLGTKTKGYYASYSGPLGEIKVGTAETDETVIPGKVVNYWGVKAATEGAVDMLKSKETTTRVLAREETSRAATKSAAGVEKLRILNPAPEAAATGF